MRSPALSVCTVMKNFRHTNSGRVTLQRRILISVFVLLYCYIVYFCTFACCLWCVLCIYQELSSCQVSHAHIFCVELRCRKHQVFLVFIMNFRHVRSIQLFSILHIKFYCCLLPVENKTYFPLVTFSFFLNWSIKFFALFCTVHPETNSLSRCRYFSRLNIGVIVFPISCHTGCVSLL